MAQSPEATLFCESRLGRALTAGEYASEFKDIYKYMIFSHIYNWSYDKAKIEGMNQKLLSALRQLPLSQSRSRTRFFSIGQLKEMHQTLSKKHELAEKKHMKEVNNDREGGLCFAFATWVHIQSLINGIDKESILKIWAEGRFRSPRGSIWSYHVATMIRAEDQNWWVVDAELGVMTVDDWYANLKSRVEIAPWHLNERDRIDNEIVRLFVSEAKRYSYGRGGIYRRYSFNSDSQVYFNDMLNALRRESKLKLDP